MGSLPPRGVMKSILERRTVGEVLEVSGPNFTQEEVKRNYKRLIKQFHPDVNKSPEAAEYTKQLNRAYAIATGKEQPPQQPVQRPPRQPVIIIRYSFGNGYRYTTTASTATK